MTKRSDLKAMVAERGQITIPKALRDKLGIVPGTIMSFEFRHGKLVLTKEIAGDPVASVYGSLKTMAPYASTDDYMLELRGTPE